MDMLVHAFNKGEMSKKRNSRNRLLFVCTPATAYGGGQQYLYRILESFDANEYNILFFFPQFKDADQFNNEITARGAESFIYSKDSGRLMTIIIFFTLLLSYRPSLIHVNSYNEKTIDILAAATLLKSLFTFNVILTQHLKFFFDNAEHGITQFKKSSFFKYPLRHVRWHMREYWKARCILGHIDKIIFVNYEYCEKYRNLLKLDAYKVSSIINGIDTDKFRPGILSVEDIRKYRQEYGLSTSDFVIIGVGNLIQQKRFDIFIEVLCKVIQKGCPVKGLIVGAGPLEEGLKKLASQKGISDSIIFAGYQTEIPTLMNIADCLLMTSDDEGLPYALLEARASGLATVATNVGGICRVINHQNDGYIAEPGDVNELCSNLMSLVINKEQRKYMGLLARRDTIERFSLKKMQEETKEEFKKLV